MAPVIWGLDLKEIAWAKFGNANMWSNRYHLRRTKIAIYQLAMIFCVVSESLGTAVMTDYLDQKEWIAGLDPNAVEHISDYVGAASYNIFAGVFVAFVFGAAFFFDLIWPERYESKPVRTAWRVCSILAVLCHAGSAFALTIVTARGAAHFTGVDDDRRDFLRAHAKHLPLRYREYARAIAAVVFIWPGTLFVIASCIIMWMSLANEDLYGTTIAAHERNKNLEGGSPTDRSNGGVNAGPVHEKPVEGDVTISSQDAVIRTGPNFEEDTAAAIEDVRHSYGEAPAGVNSSRPTTTSGHGAQPRLFA